MNAHEKLEKIAEGVVHDVSEMVEQGTDLGYDMYIEELRDESGVRHTYGLIDMGEFFQQGYIWNGRDWDTINDDPYALEERILRVRGFNERYN